MFYYTIKDENKIYVISTFERIALKEQLLEFINENTEVQLSKPIREYRINGYTEPILLNTYLDGHGAVDIIEL